MESGPLGTRFRRLRERTRQVRVLLVGNYLPDQQNSMLRYSRVLSRKLTDLGFTVEVINPITFFGYLSFGPLFKWLGYLDKYLLFPIVLLWYSRKWDQCHICDHSNSVYLPWIWCDNVSITCHDLLAVGAAEGTIPLDEIRKPISWSGRQQQRWIIRNLLRAKNIVCVSETTAQQLLQRGYTGNPSVIYNPPVREFKPITRTDASKLLSPWGLAPDTKYFLHVGGNQWYKNRHGALKLFAALRRAPLFASFNFVLAGPPPTEALRKAIGDLALDDFVIICERPSDQVVDALYSNAQALLFPSFREGFGWPLIEAQFFGCLVVTSDREPLIEVSGGAAIYIDPNNPDGSARDIAVKWSNRERLIEAGAKNFLRFSSDRFAVLYHDFIQRSIGKWLPS